MTPDVQNLIDRNPAGVWVALDVLMEALDVNKRRAYQLVSAENIRSTPTRPRQYNLNDIARVARARKAQS